ncbi:MAG TPA: hypothetical protein VK116_02470, partial [Planctomycetota bacterium]|nr:hypothetical protein [Planctomycetota bacterium]
DSTVEDFALAWLDLDNDVSISLSCSWRLSLGRDVAIELSVFGDRGGLRFANVGGSYHDFELHRFRGTSSEKIVAPPDAWGGRAVVDWAARLASDPSYDAAVEEAVVVASTIDRIYRAGADVPAARSETLAREAIIQRPDA